jgi:hypothetical protein
MKTFVNGLYFTIMQINQSIMKYSVIIACLVIITSCTKDYQFGNVGISEISIPDSVKVNELVKIIIKAEATNGCWSNLSIEFTEKNVFEYLIQASGKFSGCKNCNCPDIMIYEDFEIDFQPKIKGIYFFI